VNFVTITILVLLIACIVLQVLRWADERNAAQVWQFLANNVDESSDVFDLSTVASLPEPAKRFFTFTIQPSAPIRTIAEIEMVGEIGLGTKEKPNYAPMYAEQILAPPYGLVWKLHSGSGALRITGSDGFNKEMSWTRFWLLGTLPIVRISGNQNHARAAFGRVVAEAVFWAPAALLPMFGVSWEAVDQDTARATIRYRHLTQTVNITVAPSGQPTTIIIPRWSDANPERTFQIQPFGGYLSEFKNFDGYKLPTRVEGGNFIGTEDYFPFYRAQVTDHRFVH
jgi:hypothetical protein